MFEVVVMLEVVKGSERQDRKTDRNGQCPPHPNGMIPISGGEVKQTRWHQCHDAELKDMCPGAFIRFGRPEVAAANREQRRDRQAD